MNDALFKANEEFSRQQPGPSSSRQPIHTVYGGAHLFSANLMQKLGQSALSVFSEYTGSPKALMRVLDIPSKQLPLWTRVHRRVQQKLKVEAVEDFRIDFEDGYGPRPDSEEDDDAERAAREVALGMAQKKLPPFIGIRIRPFTNESHPRSIRTLEKFFGVLFKETKGKLPTNFVTTLPKVTVVEQVQALVRHFEALEKKWKLPVDSLKFEFMVEMPQIILSEKGSPLRDIVDAGKGRCTGAHFGTYDYTAGCQITAAHQAMKNPVCDFAKNVMQVMLVSSGIQLSDGATNVMPVGPHKSGGKKLSTQERSENRAVITNAFRMSYANIRHSLETGFYQGWDLHPAQLPVRFAATYAFFLESFEASTQRLKAFLDKASKATLLGDIFDDAATGQGLLNFFLIAYHCGAILEEDVAKTGLTIAELQTRSFVKILKARLD